MGLCEFQAASHKASASGGLWGKAPRLSYFRLGGAEAPVPHSTQRWAVRFPERRAIKQVPPACADGKARSAFPASAQQKSALRRPNRLSASASLLFAGCPLYSTTPRSLQRRTGGLLLDRSFQYALPLAFLRYRPDAGETGELRGLPIHKTSLHADVCSGCYQNLILVWLIIVRCVSSLGSSGVSRFEEFLDSERRWGLDLENLLS